MFVVSILHISKQKRFIYLIKSRQFRHQNRKVEAGLRLFSKLKTQERLALSPPNVISLY